MKIVRVEQGTDEWDRIRVGKITASMMDSVFAASGTKSYDVALNNLVCDLQGVDRFFTEDEPWFEMGKLHEPDAIFAYELRHGVDTWRDAFLIHNDYEWLGCSPDFLIGDPPTEGGEVKCRRYVASYMDAIHAPDNKYQRLGRAYFLQIQTAMLITGFDRWKLVNYYIGGENAAPREADRDILRDDAMIERILERAKEFYATAKAFADKTRPGKAAEVNT